MTRRIVLLLLFSLMAMPSLIECVLPKFINEVCYADDPKVDDCILRLAAKYLDEFTDGVPELNIPSLDPAVIREIEIKSSGFNLTFENSKLYGNKKTVFKKFKFDVPNRKVMINFDSDLTLKGNYEVSGLISIVRIEGKGKYKIDVKSNFDAVLDYGKKDNIWKIIDRSFSYNISHAHFDLSNLFNGKQEALAKAALAFLNQSWELVMYDVAPPAITQIVDAIIFAINRLFSHTSPDELFHLPPGYKF